MNAHSWPVKRLFPALILLLLLTAGRPAAAQDTTAAPTPSHLPEDHSPQGALWRALAAPGWGQYYNRHYLKIPLVYAGLGGFGYGVVHTHNQYTLYRDAHKFKRGEEMLQSGQIDEEEFEERFQQYEDDYREIESRVGEVPSSAPLRNQRENLRRYRDLFVIGGVLFYGLSVLDAYVSAHLLGFDIDEDLSVHVIPHAGGATASFSLRF